MLQAIREIVMNNPEQSKFLEDYIQTIGEVGALSDLVAALIADRSMQSADPAQSLEKFIEAELSAIYNATALDDENSPTKDRVRAIKIQTKNGVFKLARTMVASRIARSGS
jgi:hypothetical protein